MLFFNCKKDNTIQNENNVILNCLIFPTGVTTETYFFKVFENGELEVTFGEKDNNLENANFKNVIWQNKSIITPNNLKLIKQYNIKLNSLRDLKRENLKKGGWEIILNSNNKRFNFYYGEQTKTAIGKIINEIIKSSPNKIDLHSWS
ncbi:hypothetical protein SU65_11745 [Flavobacterium psychrophilum]|nr:hypothetical protein SU65_11745 [Flavobacterium psychrophilum]